MQTLFLSNFHAHTYAAAGLRNVVAIKGNLDFRLEGFVFQPYREIEKTEDLKSKYGKIFERRYYIGSGGLVFHSPVGPVSLFVNYYHERKNPFSVLFHIGYIIFNKSALD
jgi:NTE family protein